MFCKKVVLRNFENSHENICARDSFFNEVAGLSPAILFKKVSLAQVFSCEFCEISKNTFLREHLRWLLLLFDRTLDMDYELSGRKNVCLFGNVIALHII